VVLDIRRELIERVGSSKLGEDRRRDKIAGGGTCQFHVLAGPVRYCSPSLSCVKLQAENEISEPMDISQLVSWGLKAVGPIKSLLVWLASQKKPLLRVGIRPHNREGTLVAVDNVSDPSRRQVVFALTLHNDGKREGRFWRLQLAGRDERTMPHLEGDVVSTRAFQRERFFSGRWMTVLEATAPGDIVPPGGSLTIPGRHTLNFPGSPRAVVLDYQLDAENMDTQRGVVRLTVDWTTRIMQVSFQEQSSH